MRVPRRGARRNAARRDRRYSPVACARRAVARCGGSEIPGASLKCVGSTSPFLARAPSACLDAGAPDFAHRKHVWERRRVWIRCGSFTPVAVCRVQHACVGGLVVARRHVCPALLYWRVAFMDNIFAVVVRTVAPRGPPVAGALVWRHACRCCVRPSCNRRVDVARVAALYRRRPIGRDGVHGFTARCGGRARLPTSLVV